MKKRIPIRWIDALVVLGIVAYGGNWAWQRPPMMAALSEFARQVNLDPLYRTAVQADGRLRSFESHAKTYIGGAVPRAHTISGPAHSLSYLVFFFLPAPY